MIPGNEEDLLKALSEQFGINYVNLRYESIDWDFTVRFSSSLIVEHKCLPLRKDDNGVAVAIVNPLDAWALSKAEEEVGSRKIKFILVSSADMESAIKRYRKFVLSKAMTRLKKD